MLALWCALCAPTPVVAHDAPGTSAPIRIATLLVPGDDVDAERVLAGEFDALFVPLDGIDARLPGGFDRSQWLRLEVTPPAPDRDALHGAVLRFERVPLERITAYLPRGDGTWRMQVDGFYATDPGIGVLPGSYAFRLPPAPPGPRTLYVNVQERHPVTLRPQLLDEHAFHLADRAVSGIAAATYAAIVVLMLSSLALFVALRERAYLQFVGMTGVFLLLLLLALNGALYTVPGVRAFGWWRDHGIYALALACCALALGFARHFLTSEAVSARMHRWIDRARIAWLAFAALSLCNIASLGPTMQRIAALAGVLTALQIAWLAWRAWRGGNALARPFWLIWSVLTVLIAVRIALAFGWLPPHPGLLNGFQVAVAFCLLLMSVGLADRVMEFRKQRDLTRELKEQTDADLQIEHVRREFAEDLRERLRMAPPGGEMEWVAFRRVLASLKAVLPQRSAAVIATGYHGIDLLLTEPLDAKDRYGRLLIERGGTLKGLCRSRSPMQVTLDEIGKEATGAAGGSLFAVVPMAMPRPGWGALLIERGPNEPFEPEELKRAAEFLHLAVTTTDEALHQAELKRKAEIDQLTGLYNRRAGDAVLNEAMLRAIADRRPLSLLFVDIDHFKQINDRHGHPVGDDCLRATAEAIRRQLGERDTAARYGGEEFLVVLPGHQPEQARQVGERIRQAIAQLRVEGEGGPVRFSVSIGVAARQAGEDTPQPVVERADRALYAAKRNGRNQVHVASSLPYGSGPGAPDREDTVTL
nr:diguanylate cyclase [Chiayiivirga flava]